MRGRVSCWLVWCRDFGRRVRSLVSFWTSTFLFEIVARMKRRRFVMEPRSVLVTEVPSRIFSFSFLQQFRTEMSTSKNSPRIVLACRNPGTKLTNNLPSLAFFLRDTLILLWFIFSLPLRVAVQRSNFRRLLRTVEALSDLGPELTAEREFAQTARVMLS